MIQIFRFVDGHPWLTFIFGLGGFCLCTLALIVADSAWTNACNTWLKVTAMKLQIERDEQPAPATTPKPEDKQ